MGACHIEWVVMKVELVDAGSHGKQGIYFAWPNLRVSTLTGGATTSG